MVNHPDPKFTGERCIPSVHGNIELEHKHRYLIAQQLAKGKTVLDITCREGYGTALLSEVAGQVIGMDTDPTIVAHAAKEFKGNNITFAVGSFSNIPLISCSVDLVVSFETIEHNDEQNQMIAEIARVLKPEGTLILSSPDKKEYSDLPHHINPYHIKELHNDEMYSLLSRNFQNVLFYGQRIVYGSIIAPINANTRTAFRSFNKSKPGLHYDIDGIDRPAYCIAIASKEKNNFSVLDTSLLDQDINQSEAILQRENSLGAQRETISQLKLTLTDTTNTITSLYSSRSWRLTRPLRQTAAVIRELRNLRHLLVTLARLIYDSCPFPPHVKTQIKGFVFTYFGTFFKGSDTYERWLDTRNNGAATNQSNLEPIETYYEKVPFSVDKITGLTFRNPEAPIVSIVIPVFNNWRYTYACLQAIRERSGDDMPYEVIIADDGSTDDTRIMLDRIKGFHGLKNTSNLGFVRNCNNAVNHARGKYVVFLNNDTEVQSDWLIPLVNLFERFSNVGMVGGRLLYADGRVQEAGGIILQNGWGHPYGRGANPASYEFNYVKEVDCLIGACLMVEKSVFLSLGGFDESFAPAFYEEFDFAFTLRKHGYKIMYQPASSILHFESSSYGAELRGKQSTINHQKFCRKWQNVLKQQAISKDDLFLARDRSQGKKIILVIDDKVPEYDRHAGGLTIYQYVRLFCDMGFKVIFLPDNLCPLAPYTSELQQLGVEVIYGDINIKEWLSEYGKYLHYAWLSRPDIASKYIDLLKNLTTTKILYYTVDLHYLRERRRYELDHNPVNLIASQRLKKQEFGLFSQVDVILTPSTDEKRVIKESFPHKNVFTISPLFYKFSPENTQASADFAEREGILFLGGFGHLPNVDAVLWFVKEILPRIREQLPEVTFTVAGSNPPQEILALQNESLRVTGYVPDLQPLFEKARVFVAPLRYGAGVKGKIITSMVYDVPVVTTSIGNEGINLADGQEALIADGPEAFAASTVELYTNQALWERLAHEAQTFVRHHFGVEKAQQLIQTVMRIL